MARKEVVSGLQDFNANVGLSDTGELLVPEDGIRTRSGNPVAFDAGINGYVTATGSITARTLASRFADVLRAKDFGAVGDGTTDDTVALNALFAAALTAGKTAFLDAGVYAVTDDGALGYALLNEGCSVVGEGRNASIIRPLSSMPSASSFMRLRPQEGADLSYIRFSEFGVFPGYPYNTSPKGKYSIHMLFDRTTNISEMVMEHLYLGPGNNWSIYSESDPVLNFQGVPANSTVRNCGFFEGVKFSQIGDSNVFKDSIFRTVNTTNQGIWLYGVDMTPSTSGPALTNITHCNLDCSGGAIKLVRGRCVSMRENNIEQTAGAGSNGAVVDIDGSGSAISMFDFSGNHVAMFGTATTSRLLRVDVAVGGRIEHNTLITSYDPAGGEAIIISANASNVSLGHNEISATFTTPITNTGTQKVNGITDLTLLNSFTNVGGAYQNAAYTKSRDGLVTLSGYVNCPVTPNGAVVAALPAYVRPATARKAFVFAEDGAGLVASSIEIGTNGNITFYTGGAPTKMSLDTITFQSVPYFIGDY